MSHVDIVGTCPFFFWLRRYLHKVKSGDKVVIHAGTHCRKGVNSTLRFNPLVTNPLTQVNRINVSVEAWEETGTQHGSIDERSQEYSWHSLNKGTHQTHPVHICTGQTIPQSTGKQLRLTSNRLSTAGKFPA